MPLERRVFVKTSIVALLLAFVWGAAMALCESLRIGIPAMLPVEHAHLAFVGWLVNLVIGIALWLLPLDRERYPRTQGRYPPLLPWLCYAFLNGGLVLRIAAEPSAVTGEHALARALLGVAALAQTAGVLAFAAVARRRVKGPARPARGVR